MGGGEEGNGGATLGPIRLTDSSLFRTREKRGVRGGLRRPANLDVMRLSPLKEHRNTKETYGIREKQWKAFGLSTISRRKTNEKPHGSVLFEGRRSKGV